MAPRGLASPHLRPVHLPGSQMLLRTVRSTVSPPLCWVLGPRSRLGALPSGPALSPRRPPTAPPVPSAATQPAFSTTVPRGCRPSASASSSGPTRPLADRWDDAVIPDSGSAAPRLGGGSAVLPHLLQKAPSQWPLRHRVTAAFLPLACGFCLFLQFILRTGFPSSRCESVCVPLSSVSGRPSWSC